MKYTEGTCLCLERKKLVRRQGEYCCIIPPVCAVIGLFLLLFCPSPVVLPDIDFLWFSTTGTPNTVGSNQLWRVWLQLNQQACHHSLREICQAGRRFGNALHCVRFPFRNSASCMLLSLAFSACFPVSRMLWKLSLVRLSRVSTRLLLRRLF